MDEPAVTLRAMGHADIEAVVRVAVAGARPRDVMPPDDEPDPETWTPQRADRLAGFLASRLTELDDGRRERPYVVEVAGRPAGVARLLLTPDGDAVEVGMWLAAGFRGRGVGSRVLSLLLAEADKNDRVDVLARTTADNAAAIGVLKGAGARLVEPDGSPGTIEARMRPITAKETER